MQRLTARLLLLFALAGNFVPVALAATAAPVHACCIRKAHRCHDSGPAESNQIAAHTTGCCNHDCCGAVTTPQWASPQSPVIVTSTPAVGSALSRPLTDAPLARLSAARSTRAPPNIAIA